MVHKKNHPGKFEGFCPRCSTMTWRICDDCGELYCAICNQKPLMIGDVPIKFIPPWESDPELSDGMIDPEVAPCPRCGSTRVSLYFGE